MHRKSRLSRDEEGCRAHRTGIRGNHGVLPHRSVRRSRQPSSARILAGAIASDPTTRLPAQAVLGRTDPLGTATPRGTQRTDVAVLAGRLHFRLSVLRLPELTAGFAAMARAHRNVVAERYLH